MKIHLLALVFSFASLSITSQVEKSTELFKILKVNDSLIFDSSFNTCNLKVLSALIHEDLEFYHDKSGVVKGRADFIKNTKNGLCKSPYKPRRELLENTLEVFPLNDNNGKLYGAVQKGKHRFYENGKTTSVALFTHLWVFENDKWMLKRVLSYDHKTE